LTSFGGPIAHLGYFRRAFVNQRQWLGEHDYAETVALCQLLPGPTSSQVGFLIGLNRAGWLGAAAAWIGFTTPSALLMLGFAVLAPGLNSHAALGAIHGLKLVAVAVVGQAVWSMARQLCPDTQRAAIGLFAFILVLLITPSVSQLAAILIGALSGLLVCRHPEEPRPVALPATIGPRMGIAAALLFVTVFFGLTLASQRDPHSPWALAAIFFRAGALVFGGGHVVLPLLRNGLVPTGWATDGTFLAGYGAAQAVPGPLFTFAAYLGASVTPNWGIMLTALLALVMVFLPGLLLAVFVFPFWARARTSMAARASIAGVNAAVVGILAAALYNPLWLLAIVKPPDLALAAAAFLLLERWKVPPLAIVVFLVAGGTVETIL
jgi:chromate transporter